MAVKLELETAKRGLPSTPVELSESIFAEQTNHIVFYQHMLQAVLDKQASLIDIIREDPVIGDDLLKRNVF